jgi:anti-sigma factor (TIGR02949 family)
MTNEGELSCPDRLADITALVDGELQGEERDRLQQHLAGCPGCAAELRRQRLSKTALRRLSLSLDATPELRSRIEEALAGSAGRRLHRNLTLVLGLAAALLILVIAGAGWYRLLQGQPSAAEVSLAARTHERVTNGPSPVTFATSDPARVASWAQSVTGSAIDEPVASAGSFKLVGARPEPDVTAKAITLVYEGNGKRISCTIVPLTRLGPIAPPESKPAQAIAIDGGKVVSWRDDKAVYMLSGDLDAGDLLRVARQIAQSD